MCLRSYGNFAKAKKGMVSCFMSYDNECRRLSLDYKTPAEVYFENEKLAALDHKNKEDDGK